MSIYNLNSIIENLNQMPTMEGINIPEVEEQKEVHSFSTTKNSSEELIKKILNGENWHSNMLLLIAHWIGRGWMNAEILATAPYFTLPNYTVAQTYNEMLPMIDSGRKK